MKNDIEKKPLPVRLTSPGDLEKYRERLVPTPSRTPEQFLNLLEQQAPDSVRDTFTALQTGSPELRDQYAKALEQRADRYIALYAEAQKRSENNTERKEALVRLGAGIQGAHITSRIRGDDQLAAFIRQKASMVTDEVLWPRIREMQTVARDAVQGIQKFEALLARWDMNDVLAEQEKKTSEQGRGFIEQQNKKNDKESGALAESGMVPVPFSNEKASIDPVTEIDPEKAFEREDVGIARGRTEDLKVPWHDRGLLNRQQRAMDKLANVSDTQPDVSGPAAISVDATPAPADVSVADGRMKSDVDTAAKPTDEQYRQVMASSQRLQSQISPTDFGMPTPKHVAAGDTPTMDTALEQHEKAPEVPPFGDTLPKSDMSPIAPDYAYKSLNYIRNVPTVAPMTMKPENKNPGPVQSTHSDPAPEPMTAGLPGTPDAIIPDLASKAQESSTATKDAVARTDAFRDARTQGVAMSRNFRESEFGWLATRRQDLRDTATTPVEAFVSPEPLPELPSLLATPEVSIPENIPSTEDSVMTKEEFKNFVNTGEVSENMLNALAQKIMNGKQISREELSVYAAHSKAVENILGAKTVPHRMAGDPAEAPPVPEKISAVTGMPTASAPDFDMRANDDAPENPVPAFTMSAKEDYTTTGDIPLGNIVPAHEAASGSATSRSVERAAQPVQSPERKPYEGIRGRWERVRGDYEQAEQSYRDALRTYIAEQSKGMKRVPYTIKKIFGFGRELPPTLQRAKNRATAAAMLYTDASQSFARAKLRGRREDIIAHTRTSVGAGVDIPLDGLTGVEKTVSVSRAEQGEVTTPLDAPYTTDIPVPEPMLSPSEAAEKIARMERVEARYERMLAQKVLLGRIRSHQDILMGTPSVLENEKVKKGLEIFRKTKWPRAGAMVGIAALGAATGGIVPALVAGGFMGGRIALGMGLGAAASVQMKKLYDKHFTKASEDAYDSDVSYARANLRKDEYQMLLQKLEDGLADIAADKKRSVVAAGLAGLAAGGLVSAGMTDENVTFLRTKIGDAADAIGDAAHKAADTAANTMRDINNAVVDSARETGARIGSMMHPEGVTLDIPPTVFRSIVDADQAQMSEPSLGIGAPVEQAVAVAPTVRLAMPDTPAQSFSAGDRIDGGSIVSPMAPPVIETPPELGIGSPIGTPEEEVAHVAETSVAPQVPENVVYTRSGLPVQTESGGYLVTDPNSTGEARPGRVPFVPEATASSAPVAEVVPPRDVADQFRAYPGNPHGKMLSTETPMIPGYQSSPGLISALPDSRLTQDLPYPQKVPEEVATEAFSKVFIPGTESAPEGHVGTLEEAKAVGMFENSPATPEATPSAGVEEVVESAETYPVAPQPSIESMQSTPATPAVDEVLADPRGAQIIQNNETFDVSKKSVFGFTTTETMTTGGAVYGRLIGPNPETGNVLTLGDIQRVYLDPQYRATIFPNGVAPESLDRWKTFIEQSNTPETPAYINLTLREFMTNVLKFTPKL